MKILRDLSPGGQGKVQLALSGSRELQVVKTCDSRGNGLREAAALSLDLPGFPKFRGAWDEDGWRSKVVIASRFLPGRLLSSADEEIAEAATISAAVKLCEIISGLHARGFCHGDLGPWNIMVPDHGVASPMVIDLGLARKFGKKAQGHGHWAAAPEQGFLEPVTRMNDVHALSATTLWLAGGFRTLKHKSWSLAKGRGVSSGLFEVLSEGLEYEPGRRTATVEQLREQLLKL